MRIGVSRETAPGERRVALVPESVGKLVKAGCQLDVERGAGAAAHFPDELYTAAGASVCDAESAWGADLVLGVQAPEDAQLTRLRSGATWIAFLDPLGHPSRVRVLLSRNITSFSMDAVPRSTRAQSMDALSSMATVAGYKAVLLGAAEMPRIMPMLTTAAGTLAPARVLVLGAGVAGLQAIATARRLGAVVEAYDVRPAAREEVESLGAKFVAADLLDAAAADQSGYAKEVSADLAKRQREALTRHVASADLIVTTARVPGRKAPVLVTSAMLSGMKPGAVVVDLAADGGGNCEGSKPGETVEIQGVRILGPVNLASTVPVHASQMYSRNLTTLVQHLLKDGTLHFDFDDEITRETCITHAGQLINPRSKELMAARAEAASV